MTEKELLDYMYGLCQNIVDTAKRNGFNVSNLSAYIVPDSQLYNGKDAIRVDFTIGNKMYERGTHPSKDVADYMSFTIDEKGDYHID